MKKIVALSIGVLFSGVSQLSLAGSGNWTMLNPAPVVNATGIEVNSAPFVAPSTPPGNAVIRRLSWDLSPYDNGNTSASYEICMLPGTSRCFNASRNLRSSTNFFNGFRATSSFMIRVRLSGGTYPAKPAYTGRHMIEVDYDY